MTGHIFDSDGLCLECGHHKDFEKEKRDTDYFCEGREGQVWWLLPATHPAFRANVVSYLAGVQCLAAVSIKLGKK